MTNKDLQQSLMKVLTAADRVEKARGASAATSGDGERQAGDSAGAGDRVQGAAMTTPYAKKKQKWRRKARAKLRLILDDQNGMCHWCMAPLVILAELNRAGIVIEQDKDRVWYRKCGVIVCSFLATVDHIGGLRGAADNHRLNIVASCMECNRLRNRMPSPKSIEKRKTCPKCGKPKTPFRRKCFKCRLGDPSKSGIKAGE